mmetsp:Transcript_9083/g.33982  ORF Transcript_9083/g.33982 Transcript_9083/m.33982 type:complete len:257 (+) Transcript_9083:536-1306(+)
MTFTSVACALTASAGLPRVRVSHTHTRPSLPQDANTLSSPGLHCRSSTDPDPCPPAHDELVSTAHRPPSDGSQTCTTPLLSPLTNRPCFVPDQSIAYPSSLCPVNANRGAARWGAWLMPLAPPTRALRASSAASSTMDINSFSCFEVSHTCTTPWSLQVAQIALCCGIHRTRFTAPWCAIFRTCNSGPSPPRPPPPPPSPSSSSEDSLSLSSESSLFTGFSVRRVFFKRVNRITDSVFCAAVSACVPPTMNMEWGK